MTYKLHYAPDNASLIVRLTLDELGAPYTTLLVDRAQRAHKSADYLRLNPNGLIPVLETDAAILFETGAILLWLADRHRALAPQPGDPERGRFLTWLFFTSNTLHADLRQRFYPQQYVGNDASAARSLDATLTIRLRAHLRALEDEAALGREWLSPGQPSVLTYYIAALMRWMRLFPVDADHSWFDLAAYPRLGDILHALETRPATQRAQAAEGLGPTPFTNPSHAQPPEGSAI